MARVCQKALLWMGLQNARGKEEVSASVTLMCAGTVHLHQSVHLLGLTALGKEISNIGIMIGKDKSSNWINWGYKLWFYFGLCRFARNRSYSVRSPPRRRFGSPPRGSSPSRFSRSLSYLHALGAFSFWSWWFTADLAILGHHFTLEILIFLVK